MTVLSACTSVCHVHSWSLEGQNRALDPSETSTLWVLEIKSESYRRAACALLLFLLDVFILFYVNVGLHGAYRGQKVEQLSWNWR